MELKKLGKIFWYGGLSGVKALVSSLSTLVGLLVGWFILIGVTSYYKLNEYILLVGYGIH